MERFIRVIKARGETVVVYTKGKYEDTTAGEMMDEDIRNVMKRLCEYEDTGLNPEQIRELKERDIAKAPKIHKNKYSDVYTCPNCALVLINKDETGWFCGKQYKFCPDCGQRLKWDENLEETENEQIKFGVLL